MRLDVNLSVDEIARLYALVGLCRADDDAMRGVRLLLNNALWDAAKGMRKVSLPVYSATHNGNAIALEKQE